MRQRFFRDEDGSILVVTMVLLVILTLSGIAVTNTSYIETQIAGNERFYKLSFYNAEGAYPAVFPVLDDIRNGVNPAGFIVNYPNLRFIGQGEDIDGDGILDPGEDLDGDGVIDPPGQDFWNELKDPNDGDPMTDTILDVTIPALSNAMVDVDRLETEIARESLINRAGYEGMGKGGASGWALYYRAVTRGTSDRERSISNTEIRITAVR